MNKNKTSIAIALLLTISMAASMMLVPNANAVLYGNVPTYSYINIAPNPIGAGQTVNVNFFVGNPPPTASGAYGDRWHDLTVDVVDPDGVKTTLGPFTSDDTGGTVTHFTPTKVGNYTFIFHFPGQTLTGENPPPQGYSGVLAAVIGDYYEPSDSAPYVLVVQAEPISHAPVIPLPTQYWTRPIFAQNNDLWYAIGGNWLGLNPSIFATTGVYDERGSYAPYTTAPNTAHIMWTKPEAFGGTMGGEFGNSQQSNFWSTSQYQPKFAPVIISGILYYTSYPGSAANPAGIKAVNLHTGEDIWTIDNKDVLRCGQIMNFLSPNEYGGRGYIWTNAAALPYTGGAILTGLSYNMYDAMTGEYVLSVVNATSFSKLLIDDHGGLNGYYFKSNYSFTGALTGESLAMWNSTMDIQRGVDGTGDLNNAWQWRPVQNGVYNFSYGVQWETPIPITYNGNPIALSITAVDKETGVILMSYTEGATRFFNPGWIITAGFSMTDGHLLWGPTNRTINENTRTLLSSSAVNNGVYLEICSETFEVTGFSLTTGNKVWGPVKFPGINPFSKLGIQTNPGPNGTTLIWTYGGDAYSINNGDGTFNWEYHAPPSGYESPYGTWPFWTFTVGTVADGKLFIPMGHMYSPPLFHHAQQMALNLTDGSVVWNITAFDVTSAPAISDGVMVTLNAYDNQIYAWGKGPSSMTVTAPDVGVTTATPVTIRGTIMDISAGTKQEAQAANFPHGLPCVSDDSMTGWMEFVYEQQPCPANVTGVPVDISVLDSNGNQYSIGTAMSDASGTYSLTWTPAIPGNFTVIANFAGSESYYPSSAESHFYASDAPTATPPPTAPPASLADIYFLPMSIVLLIAIIVAAIAIVLMLRKR